MYCVYDNRKNVIAFHDDLNIIETYVDHVMTSHKDAEDQPELYIGKIKNKKLKRMTDIDNLYLVRYADTYVQSGYLTYLELLSSQCVYDEQLCKDVLLRILECNDITSKERKSLERSVEVVDRLLQTSKKYTPTLDELKGYESEYSPYLYNKWMYIDDK